LTPQSPEDRPPEDRPPEDRPPDDRPSDDHPSEARPRPLMGAAFWIALAFGLACVAAGWLVAHLAPGVLARPN
jgi:hypothetical protein